MRVVPCSDGSWFERLDDVPPDGTEPEPSIRLLRPDGRLDMQIWEGDPLWDFWSGFWGNGDWHGWSVEVDPHMLPRTGR